MNIAAVSACAVFTSFAFAQNSPIYEYKVPLKGLVVTPEAAPAPPELPNYDFATFTTLFCTGVSADGLSVVGPQSSNDCGATVNVTLDSGKYYFEVQNTAVTEYPEGFGAVPVVTLGGSSYAVPFAKQYGYAVDISSKTVRVLDVTNNCSTVTEYSFAQNSVTPGVFLRYSMVGRSSISATFNFGQSTFSCHPSGYNPGWYLG